MKVGSMMGDLLPQSWNPKRLQHLQGKHTSHPRSRVSERAHSDKWVSQVVLHADDLSGGKLSS